jgi:hypothetical protein
MTKRGTENIALKDMSITLELLRTLASSNVATQNETQAYLGTLDTSQRVAGRVDVTRTCRDVHSVPYPLAANEHHRRLRWLWYS